MPHSHMSSTLSAPQKAAIYAASCNPPRKAKKLRADSLDVDQLNGTGEAAVHSTFTTSSSTASASSVSRPSITPATQNVRIRPAPPTAGCSTASAHSPNGMTPSAAAMLPTSSGDSTTAPPGPKRRGRKPGAMSRSARETQRKINHSRIEKARRSKINDALDALRRLVPSDFGKEKEIEDEIDQSSKANSKKEEKEREFKLDILERTVLFVQDLIDKVNRLEQGHASSVQCECQSGRNMHHTVVHGDVTRGRKRKREIHDRDDHRDDEDGGLSVASDVPEEGEEDDELSELTDGEEPAASIDRPSLPIEGSKGRESQAMEVQRQRGPSSDNVRLPSISNLLNHVPPEAPPSYRSGSRSAHNSPYAPFGAHLFSPTTHAYSPSSMRPVGSASMSRRASTSSSVLAFSPSFPIRVAERNIAGNSQEVMSPLALGLPSPPASGNTNPHGVDPGPPPALKLPSPGGSPPEMQKMPLPGTVPPTRRPSMNVGERARNEDAAPSRWQPTSPSWTREDESAASLLLQISSTSSSSNSRSDSSSASPPMLHTVPQSRVPPARPLATGKDASRSTQVSRRHASSVSEHRPSGMLPQNHDSDNIGDNVPHPSLEAQTPGRLLGIRTKLS